MCVYIYMCVCTYACMYICMYIHMYFPNDSLHSLFIKNVLPDHCFKYTKTSMFKAFSHVEWIKGFSVILTVNIHDNIKNTSTIQTVICLTFKALLADVVCCLVCICFI